MIALAPFRTDAFREFKFDPKAQRYRIVEGAGKGSFVSKEAFLTQTDRYLTQQKDQLIGLGDRLSNGDINLRQFQQLATERLREIHTSQAILAANGVENMKAKDWAQVGNILKGQYYAGRNEEGDRFGVRWLAKDILDGNVTPGQLRQRLSLFAESGKRTFWAITAAKSGKPFAIRKLGIAEHCEDCIKYSKLPPTKIEDVILPGDRCQCLNNCKCSLEFLTDSEAKAIGRRSELGAIERKFGRGRGKR